MSKSLSLLLSAALTFGSAFSVQSAPLARKADVAKSPHAGMQATMQAKPQSDSKLRFQLPKTRTLTGVEGLQRLESEIKVSNRRALRSATAASRRQVADKIDLRGVVIFANSWEETNVPAYGIYTIPKSADGTFERVVPFDISYNYGAVDDGNGRFYGVNYYEYWGYAFITLDAYDTETWGRVSSNEYAYFDAMSYSAALDPVTGNIYGNFLLAEEGSETLKNIWSIADYPNSTSIPIKELPVRLIAVGADKNGQFYGVGNDDMLYKIDKTTGDLEEIATVESRYAGYSVSGCVNDDNNTFLLTYSNDGVGGLLEIDLETGATTELLPFSDGEEVVGLHIAKPAAEDKAPAAPGFSVTCVNGSMDVEIHLTMPATLFDGTPATGQTFSYSVLAEGVEVLAGEAASGEQVVKSVTLAESGVTNFVATVSNSTGVSPKVKDSCFVGKGAPASPRNVVLVWADGVATLTWDAVTDSSDGGFLDPAEVTYTILDSEGAELDTQFETTYTAQVPKPDHYMMLGYKVKANYGGKSSSVVSSNEVPIGDMTPPLEMDMTNAYNFSQHSVVDGNGDLKKWSYSGGLTSYPYSSSKADDWLFSPAITFKASQCYKLTAKVACAMPAYPERIEIAFGNSASPEGMTEILVAPTLVSKTVKDGCEVLEGYIRVAAECKAFIGFHAISDPDMFKLVLDSYSISLVDGSMPGQVTDLSVVPDENYALKTAISFKAPATTFGGSSIWGDVTVKVLRGETTIAEKTVAPGASVNIEDTDMPAKGSYTYYFIPVSSEGETGIPASVNVFVGANTPANIDLDTVSMVETIPGTFHLSWGAVTTDVDGAPVNPAHVKYRVHSVVQSAQGLAIGDMIEEVTTTTYTHVIDPITEQGYFYLAVLPVNATEVAGSAALGATLTGTPYEMPVKYSSTEDVSDKFFGVSGTAKVLLADDSSIENVASQDEDNSYFVIQGQYVDNYADIHLGKVNVSGENSVLVFYIMPNRGDDINVTTVSVTCDNEVVELGSFVHNEGFEPKEWNKIKVSLDQFAGKTIQVSIRGIVKKYISIIYDNIQICKDLNYDLSASISAPVKVSTGEEFDIDVAVANEGAEDADSYSVNLLRNGEIVETKVLTNGLPANEKETITFRQSIGLHDGESADFQAVVIYEADEKPANNESKVISVARYISTLPVVNGLEGEKTEAGNALTWEPVVIEKAQPADVDEGFEDAEPWAHEFDGWRFVDVDNSPVGGFDGLLIPGLISGDRIAYFVFDASADGFNDTFAAHGGDKYLAAMYRKDDGATDDWAISPMLPGEAQTISFFAKSYHSEYKENIEVWYSTADDDVSSFVKLEDFDTKEVPNEWTEYSADLPAGATYFAIRSCAVGAFMLMLDDFTFTKLDGFTGELMGYNVYCDGVKLNDAPVSEASYLHVPTDDAAHTYHVTAVYDKGESELSEPVTIEQSGIGSVLATGLKVVVEGRSIVVTGAGDSLVTINAVDGKTLHAAKGDARVAVAPAVYLVTVDRKTVKVIVR